MSWKPEYIILIVVSTIIDYVCGIKISEAKNKKTKKLLLIVSLISNLGILFGFKYFNFFNESTREVFNFFSLSYAIHRFDLLLPVGISFYTFQTLSYTIEIYRGKMLPEKHLGRFALYVSFFPQLVAGPIERANNLIPQFKVKQNFNYDKVKSGMLLIAWGLFKKVVIADRLAVFVDAVYNNPGDFQGFPLILATFFFAFQIYCDFSGYSDIAIGSARIMGYDLMENFRRPYFSKSVSEFWKRWHISLSTWFRDYVYIPLGGNKTTKARWQFNLLFTFFISGLWHGANWTFIIWGTLNGLYLILPIWINSLWSKLNLPKIKLNNTTRFLSTFSLICFAWIFFRANTISDAFYISSHLFSGWNEFMEQFNPGSKIGSKILFLYQTRREFWMAVLSVFTLVMVHWWQRRGNNYERFKSKPIYVRWGLYIILILSIINFGVTNEVPFIYFQF